MAQGYSEANDILEELQEEEDEIESIVENIKEDMEEGAEQEEAIQDATLDLFESLDLGNKEEKYLTHLIQKMIN
jgi:hypothetical protein